MRNIIRIAQEEHAVHGVKEILNRLTTYCHDRHLDVYLKYFNKPASSTDISALEKSIGIKLPRELAEFLKIHNGADVDDFYDKDHPIHDIFGTQMSSTEYIEGTYECNTGLLEDGDFDDMHDEVDAGPGVKKVWWDAKWIPFTHDGGGNSVCIDMSPASGGTKGQIIKFDHDYGARKVIANSFVEWLDQKVEKFIEHQEKELEKASKAPETPPAKKSWWPW